MATLQPTIDQIKQKSKYFRKDELITFVGDSLSQVEKINGMYIRYFEEPNGDGDPLLTGIEKKLDAIKTKYEDLFSPSGEKSPKVAELEQKIQEIKTYHQELLNGDGSISADIKDSQDKITEFYTYLFGDADGNAGQEDVVKNAIESITGFNSELTKTDGIKISIENARDKIVEAYTELFEGDGTNPGKYPALTKVISDIESFDKKVKGEISPFIKEKQTEISNIEKDIKTKGIEIGSLLSNATTRTLAQGYLESMRIYGFLSRNIVTNPFNLKTVWQILQNLASLTKNILTDAVNYLLFLLPMVIIGFIFTEPYFFKELLGVSGLVHNSLMGTQYLLYKISVSTPLLWISWLGQRNISQRKRLFEEYNHKLRVVQMYLMFTSKEKSYSLVKIKTLEDILLDVIGRNPASQVLKRDQTMLDKLIELVSAIRGNKPIAEINGVNNKLPSKNE